MCAAVNPPIQELLVSLGICSDETIEILYPRVRDRDDVQVMRCSRSGVIFLSSCHHSDAGYHDVGGDFGYWNAGSRREAALGLREDDQRRSDQIRGLVCNRKWLDFGTGAGGILDLLASTASIASAVEIQAGSRNALLQEGFQVYQDLQEVEDAQYDVITVFHVLEHLIRPLETLALLRSKLVDGGVIIVEVPHARDFLIDFLQLDSFKGFTFWSEHLILHTRHSLEVFLKEARFTNIAITGFQRYPLANHFHWLSGNGPGGHQKWPFLRSQELDQAYANLLKSIDKTDTLIAIGHKSPVLSSS
jgi:2-polyprenyl-3-methyl-5-hydroxy-6-metoxy-1,4-benzoquinol methylase